ncbi:hypothetical protein D3C87_2092960 [compost metagenome]
MAKSNGTGTRHRSAISGQFVTERKAANNPKTTLSEKVDGGSTNGVHRSAVTGKFVPDNFARRNPRITIKDN